jgi:superfamily II DNA or RNA helicase
MSDVLILKRSEADLIIRAEPSILQEISDLFTFDVPGARFHPAFKAKQWDGKIRLFSMFKGTLYAGLKQHILQFCVENNYSVDDQYGLMGETVSDTDVIAFANALNVCSGGKPILPHDYQYTAVTHAITEGRTLLLSPTASGKSLILYLLSRWHGNEGRRQLIIVPTTSLVEQLYSDFADYSTVNGWDVSSRVVKIYSGKEKLNTADVAISTWQSIYKLPKSFFEPFDVVYGDEAHLFKAKSLTSILDKCVRTKYRIGTTGTLDGSKTNKLVLEGLFGPVFKVTDTKSLMDSKRLAQLKIKALVLDYVDEERKYCKKLKEYSEEVRFLTHHTKRNKFIRNLTLSLTGNTLLLFQFVEHGKALYEAIKQKAGADRKVFLVYGATDAVSREEVRALTERENNAIIVASNGTFSTGTNIRRLHNIIFASPSKSRIRTLQSIGRGLRTAEEKTGCTLYDIGDDLSWKKRKNYTLLHLTERIKLYNEEKFDYWIGRVQL